MNKADPWQIARYVLIGVGSLMAGRESGIVSGSDLEAIAGGIVAIASTAWGIYVRWNTSAVPKEVAASPDIPVQSSATGKVATGPGT